MKSIIVPVIILFLFIQNVAFSEKSTLTYVPPEHSTATVLNNKWIVNTHSYSRSYIKTDVHYKLQSKFVESIGIFNKRFYKLKKDNSVEPEIVSSFGLPTVALASKYCHSINIAYDIVSKKGGNILYRSQMYFYSNIDVRVVPHRPGYFIYIFNDINKHTFMENGNIVHYADYYIYRDFVKPLVDALYEGNDIILHLKDLNGNVEELYIDSTGFGNAMLRFDKM